MEMRIAAVAALTVLFAPALAAVAAESAPTLEMSAEGEIQIATDGHVSAYRLQSKLPQAVADLVDKNVRGWSFEPVVIDGQPMVAKTAMHLGLRAEPVDGKDNYRIRVGEVRFGAPRRDSKTAMHPPHYPAEAVAAHLGAKVLLAVRIDADGKITDAQPYQTSLDARTRSEAQAERWRRLFERASLAAARGWRWDLSETIDGKTVGTSALVPIVFSVHEFGKPAVKDGVWKAYVPGPVHPAPWMGDKQVAENGDLSTLGEDQSVALDSHFRLKTDVVGKVL